MWNIDNTPTKQNLITLYQPNPIKVSKYTFTFNSIETIKPVKELRLYTDKAKVRIYKPGIINKINQMIGKDKVFTLDFLPKRITNSYTNNLKINFILEEGEI